MLFPGAIRKKDGAGTEVTPLITTTAEGNIWEAQSFELSGPMGPDVGTLAGKFHKGVEKLCVAARVTGKFKSAFASKPGAEAEKPADDSDAAKKDDKPVDAPEAPKDDAKVAEANIEKKDAAAPDAKAEENKDDHVKEAAIPNSVFVVADVDLITDAAAYQKNPFF